MEAERVLRGGERDRASPVNGERFCRSFCPLHRLSADRGARSQRADRAENRRERHTEGKSVKGKPAPSEDVRQERRTNDRE